MKSGIEQHLHQSIAASRELIEIEEAFKRREKQLPVLLIFLLVALSTSLYHLFIGF